MPPCETLNGMRIHPAAFLTQRVAAT
jgi:hypothetical protein